MPRALPPRLCKPLAQGFAAFGLRHAGCALLLSGALCTVALAQPVAPQVALSGMSGGKALLVIDGGAPRFLSVGQSWQGVRLLSADGDSAVVEINGQRQTLRVGESPVSLGKGTAPAGGSRIVLTADASGHFNPQGQINGRAVQFMVDTGATSVGIGEPEARRLNLKFESARRVKLQTANGTVIGHVMKLDSVRIGDVVVYNVDAVISPQPMPYVLLGNSFLSRFQLQRTNDQLTLERRY